MTMATVHAQFLSTDTGVRRRRIISISHDYAFKDMIISLSEMPRAAFGWLIYYFTFIGIRRIRARIYVIAYHFLAHARAFTYARVFVFY